MARADYGTYIASEVLPLVAAVPRLRRKSRVWRIEENIGALEVVCAGADVNPQAGQ